MLVTWRYRERNTIIQRLDPRARIIFMLCAMFSLIQFWDIRFIFFFFIIGITQFRLARLTWEETRRFWLILSVIITVLSIVTALTGRGGVGVYDTETPIWQGAFSLLGGTFRPTISAERVAFFFTQITRFLTFALFAVPIPFTIHPARYGITFRRLGVPDSFAFATDLAFRFIPSLGSDFQTTLDAQRARGYELERLGSGLVQQIRNMAPLIIPLVIGSIVRSEEVIDAMDLRGFGVHRRSWLEQLQYGGLDYLLTVFSIVLLLTAIILNLLGYGNFWVPAFLTEMAIS